MKLTRNFYGTLLVGLTLTVAGCGSDSNDNSTAANPASETFVAAVQKIAATSPDDTEPVSIDALVATQLDDVEPVAL